MALSVVVITKNEEANIERCLSSVEWADELVIIDSQSTDKTVEIATRFGARIFSPVWRGYGPAKQEGVDRATHEWILSIDADEVVEPTLAKEIQDVVASETDRAGYYMPRKTEFLGRWILHCGWYPDRLVRLFRKSKGRLSDAVVHEEVVVDGPVGYLSGHLLHYSYPDLEHYLRKFNTYTTLGAEEAFRAGRKAGWTDLVVRPPVAFIKHYISRQGFRDGVQGFIVSVLSATAVLVKYAKLWNKEKQVLEDDNNG